MTLEDIEQEIKGLKYLAKYYRDKIDQMEKELKDLKNKA